MENEKHKKIVQKTQDLETQVLLSQRRRRRRRMYLRLALVLGIFGALILGGEWLVIRSSLFDVREIKVGGSDTIGREDILRALAGGAYKDKILRRFLGLGNILAWPDELDQNELKFLPNVERILLTKDYSAGSVFAEIKERQPFGIWCQIMEDSREAEPVCSWFDRGGKIISSALYSEGSLIAVVRDHSRNAPGLDSYILPNKFIANALSVFDALLGSGASIKEIKLNDPGLQELEILTYDGPRIYFSLRFPAASTLEVLKSLMEKPGFQKLEYVDFRVENRVYYK